MSTEQFDRGNGACVQILLTQRVNSWRCLSRFGAGRLIIRTFYVGYFDDSGIFSLHQPIVPISCVIDKSSRLRTLKSELYSATSPEHFAQSWMLTTSLCVFEWARWEKLKLFHLEKQQKFQLCSNWMQRKTLISASMQLSEFHLGPKDVMKPVYKKISNLILIFVFHLCSWLDKQKTFCQFIGTSSFSRHPTLYMLRPNNKRSVWTLLSSTTVLHR